MMAKVGLIGTGLMGLPMAQRLLDAEISLVAYNRSADKLEPLRQAGAEIAPSVPALLQACEAVILMLSDANAIQDAILSEAAKPCLANRTVIQMGTIAPSESKAIHDAVLALGGQYLEAPVLGSIPEVKQGTLLVMVGATPDLFETWLPLLKHFGPEPRWVGPVGSAAALKLALNQLIASLTTAFAQSLSLIQQQQVDVDAFMQILRQSALYAPTFDKKLQRMLDGNYDNPNFPTRHLLKDTNLFLQEAIASGVQVDSLDGVRQILEKAVSLGLADADYSALFAAVKP